jgi:hypothetical protein
MREFKDSEGRTWVVSVDGDGGPDYKGRFHMVLTPTDGSEQAASLLDVRWNSERTARRTVETMSVVELRRRLRSAKGRAPSPT